jgi:hypothetical protein
MDDDDDLDGLLFDFDDEARVESQQLGLVVGPKARLPTNEEAEAGMPDELRKWEQEYRARGECAVCREGSRLRRPSSYRTEVNAQMESGEGEPWQPVR